MKLSRRTLLRGTAAAVALPTLEVMLNVNGTAYAQGMPLPLRFVTWFFGNGVLRSKWTPSVTGAGWQLTEQLSGLVDASKGIDVKSYVSVVSGYDVKTPNLRGHHNGVAALYSGAPFIPLTPTGGAGYSSKFGMMSIDQVAADKIAGNTTFKSLQLAVSKRFTRGEGPTLQYLSHRGPDAPMPQETNPAALFSRLFMGFTPKDPTDPRDRLRVNVLDAVKDDAKRLQTQVSAADKARLDQHLTAISEVRSQILALPSVITSSCAQPATVTNTNQDVNQVEQYETVNKIFSDLMALAFACDLTRVVSYQFTGSVGGQCFKDLSPGQPRDNEHALTHDAAQQGAVNEGVKFTIRNFAYLLDRLKKSVEGTGNVLDRSCLLCSTDVAEGLDHSINDYPILVAGRGGGALRYPGIHERGSGGKSVSNVLLTCLQAVGTGVTSVGKDSGLSTTPVAALKA
ncbi:MAG: DUF1552 domain-containing protein [Archangiaceae bacterium]|nr:DUF1552 domain-containing protein [Archangiaceae bacterium]